ncbi:MAG: DnaA/Hda family protein, partial [Candidatus Hydrogenedentes bacterium]|nr:DnaA/Hda family protein [Candidatus Hydrogenedentota bacterium]
REPRLISRFASGIVAELKPPGWETRMKILRQHLGAEGVALPEEICSLVAMRVSNDMRKMVGSLRKMMAFAALTKEAISVEMATEILSHIGGGEAA